jgi:methionine sulfoxide reductase heme-binding subunit
MRHLLIVLAAVLLVALFGLVHQQWSPMHRWNKATADASILLLSMTMALGPLAKLWPAWGRLLPFRRELGIHAVLLALVHTLIILDGWIAWDLARLVGFEFHPSLRQYVMVQHGFGLANLIGVLALAYGLILVTTSNDRSVRFLGGAVWKFVQRSAYVLWALVVIHTAYFLFMHFLDFHRPTPPANPLQWPFAVLVTLILILRWAASIHSWRGKRPADGYRGDRLGASAVTVENEIAARVKLGTEFNHEKQRP